MSTGPVDRRLRRLLDSTGLGVVIIWPVLCVVAAMAAWLLGE